ncbi:uroporphyrinogen-III C-methyltransferase [Archaeoglobus sulfaticallidus PM70-1]|uniref:uroporphyrinogen-III C-methyltransferase n=1 Tax=Archaeoglobus sulfaticallidus PM70-1 TaxID=387631 RepID=N0BAG0_9EURY|nr:uroporphyrinogen-III C-methyltransferase [Archaeoglobus sulfaticallidus]AGK60584.1 uroporphyrinogen-III C-methyltransferase [Archaeoglobus sulfaticallidus PM70-1]
MVTAKGEVYLIGAGPGDPELLTLKALRLIREADVALIDDLIGDEIKELVRRECKEVIDVGKRAGRHKKTQDEINELLYRYASEGKKVARIKGGDPFVFGRGGEEAEFLAERGIRVKVVPGISSAIAAPPLAGIPLNHRRFSPAVVIMTGRERESREGKERITWDALAKINATIVILMGVSNLERNVRKLIEHGKDPETPVAIIENATMENQRVVEGKLKNIAEIARKKGVKAPAIIIIGDVVGLRETLRDFVSYPDISQTNSPDKDQTDS